MERVLIIGGNGCGKTTLAQKLASKLELPLIHLDVLYWRDNWKVYPAPIVFYNTSTHLWKVGLDNFIWVHGLEDFMFIIGVLFVIGLGLICHKQIIWIKHKFHELKSNQTK